MKIITWNCNMAFRKKMDLVLNHQPDLVIVQECEHPDKFNFENTPTRPTQFLWLGNNRNKGLGILSFSDFTIKLHKKHNENLQLIAPISVSNGESKFLLYAIWAHNPNDKDGRYITQVWKALKHYSRIIREKNTILIGDFNSNTIWDRPRRDGNHSDVVKSLATKNIHSVYHKYFNQEQGTETHPTYFLYKDKYKPYHIDYCFASNDFLERLSSVQIGEYGAWKKYSDHVPIIVTFNNEAIH